MIFWPLTATKAMRTTLIMVRYMTTTTTIAVYWKLNYSHRNGTNDNITMTSMAMVTTTTTMFGEGMNVLWLDWNKLKLNRFKGIRGRQQQQQQRKKNGIGWKTEKWPRTIFWAFIIYTCIHTKIGWHGTVQQAYLLLVSPYRMRNWMALKSEQERMLDKVKKYTATDYSIRKK